MRNWQEWLIVVVAVVFVVAFSTMSYAVPPARSAQECGLLADMAIVAQAHARGGVERDASRTMMLAIYEGAVQKDAVRAKAWIDALLKLVAQPEMRAASAAQMAEAVGMACQMNQGDLSLIFGRET